MKRARIKFFKTIFWLFFSIVTLLSPVYAVTKTASPFKITLHTGLQDPSSFEFDIVAIVTSDSKNDRVTTTWNLPKGIEPINEKHLVQNVNIDIGTNVYSIRVKPQGETSGYVNFTVESYGSKTRSLTNQRGMITTNKELKLQPITQEFLTLQSYHSNRNIMLTMSFVLFGISLVLYIAKNIIEKFFPLEPVSTIPRNSKILSELERRRIEESISLKSEE